MLPITNPKMKVNNIFIEVLFIFKFYIFFKTFSKQQRYAEKGNFNAKYYAGIQQDRSLVRFGFFVQSFFCKTSSHFSAKVEFIIYLTLLKKCFNYNLFKICIYFLNLFFLYVVLIHLRSLD